MAQKGLQIVRCTYMSRACPANRYLMPPEVMRQIANEFAPTVDRSTIYIFRLDIQEEILALPGADYFVEGFELFQLDCAISLHKVGAQHLLEVVVFIQQP